MPNAVTNRVIYTVSRRAMFPSRFLIRYIRIKVSERQTAVMRICAQSSGMLGARPIAPVSGFLISATGTQRPSAISPVLTMPRRHSFQEHSSTAFMVTSASISTKTKNQRV